MPNVTVTNPLEVEQTNFEQHEADRRDRATDERIAAHKGALQAATTEEQRLAAELAGAEADLAAHTVDRARIAEWMVEVIARIDADLEPLQAECLRRAQAYDYSAQAESLRARRDRLALQREQAERPLAEFDRNSGWHARELRERIADLRTRLAAERARLAWLATATTTLEQACKSGRSKLAYARSALAEERDAHALYGKRLSAAHETINEAHLMVEQVAHEQTERDEIVGQAFIAGKQPDQKKLADVDTRLAASKERAAAATTKADAARSAIPIIERAIADREAAILTGTEKVAAAEEVLARSVADLERRLTEDAQKAFDEAVARAKSFAASFREVETESL